MPKEMTAIISDKMKSVTFPEGSSLATDGINNVSKTQIEINIKGVENSI